MPYNCKYCGRLLQDNHHLGRKSVYCSSDCKKAFLVVDQKVRQKRFHDKRARLKDITSSYYAMMLATSSRRNGNLNIFCSWVRHEFDGNISEEELNRIINELCEGNHEG